MRRCEAISQQTGTDSVGQWVKREVTTTTTKWGEQKQAEVERERQNRMGDETNGVICVYLDRENRMRKR